MNNNVNFDSISHRIEEILYEYVKCRSFTNTSGERTVESFFDNYLSLNPYFVNNKEYCGFYPLPEDVLNRKVCWAMVKGAGEKTVVLVHHYDVVDVEDYKSLRHLAFSPRELKEELKKHIAMLPEDARKDLEEDTFIFGRGVCDMKGGGAIQLALLEEYSKLAEKGELEGNVIVIGVPDEENLSGGMRAAVCLLAELKERYKLDYMMMFNSEPHQRKNFAEGIFSEGSVGKLMPFVYVRGMLSHAGKVFEGYNPIGLLSEVAARTETSMAFADKVGNEVAPPPTWLYMKDSKDRYDVSMPLYAYGCFSVLTLKQTPAQVVEKVRTVCCDAFEAVNKRIAEGYRIFSEGTGRDNQPAASEAPASSWKVKVTGFQELYEEALRENGDSFSKIWEQKKNEIISSLERGDTDMLNANLQLIETIYDYIDDISPRIVYGLLPPYYPNVTNLYFDGISDKALKLCGKLQKYTRQEFGQTYTREYFYTGICDLSYINIDDASAHRKAVSDYMPLFESYYDVPFEAIQYISMPGMNIGPWGKAFHKFTERVNREDLLERTPKILDAAIAEMLS